MSKSKTSMSKNNISKDSKSQRPSLEQQIQQKITNGWAAAVIAAIIAGSAMIANFSMAELTSSYAGFQLLNMLILFALAYGIYRQSRIASVALLVYFFASRFTLYMESPRPFDAIIAFIFLYYFAQACLAIFQQQKLSADSDGS